MKGFYELKKLEFLIKNNQSLIRTEQPVHVKVEKYRLPIWSVCMGSREPGVLVLALFVVFMVLKKLAAGQCWPIYTDCLAGICGISFPGTDKKPLYWVPVPDCFVVLLCFIDELWLFDPMGKD